MTADRRPSVATAPAPWMVVGALTLMALSGCAALSDSDGQDGRNHVQLWSGPADPVLIQVYGDPASSGAGKWPGRLDAHVALGDIDGDGSDEMVAAGNDRVVRVYTADGKQVAALGSRYPPSWHIEDVLNEPAIAVMRPGEAPSIVTTNPGAFVEAWRFDPLPDDPWHFTKTLELRVDGCYRSPGMDASPVVADLDRDGEMEILVQTEETGLFAIETDGSLMWQKCWAGGNSNPVADDLDGDGRLEALFISDAGFLSVLDGATGAPQWTYDIATKGNITPASAVVSPTVAELDGQAPKEVLFTVRHAPREEPDEYADFHMAIGAVRQNLTTWQAELVWMRQPAWAHPMSHTPLVVQDVDGDGKADIFGMDWNTIGHRPGDWSVLGPAHLFRLAADGSDVWVKEIESWWSNKAIVLVDADGDGELEILANGPRGGLDGVWRINATDGRAEGTLIADGWKMTRGPQVASMEPGGGLEIVFAVEPDDGTHRGAVLRYGLGVAAPEGVGA